MRQRDRAVALLRDNQVLLAHDDLRVKNDSEYRK